MVFRQEQCRLRVCNDDNEFKAGTQFVRREWCTCLRRSRADGEDSGFPFGIFGRGRVSVHRSDYIWEYVLISSVSRFAECTGDCLRVSASHHHAGWTSMYTFLFTEFETNHSHDRLSEHFLQTRQIVSTWTMHVALSACTRV